MIRIPLLPIDAIYELFDDPDKLSQGVDALLANQSFREALWIASPSLAREAEKVEKGACKKQKDVLLAVLRYAIRAATRPTPFGGFAGVGPASLAQRAEAMLESPPRYTKRARLDFGGVMQLVKALDKDPLLRSHLLLYTNPTLYRWKDHLRLLYRSAYGSGQDIGDLWVRRTELLDQALSRCESPILYDELIQVFHTKYPLSNKNHITAFIDKLIDEELLLTFVRPVLTNDDPLRYIVEFLPREMNTETGNKVRKLHGQIAQYNGLPLGEGISELRASLVEAGHDGEGPQRHLQVDLGVKLQHATVPKRVLRDLRKTGYLLGSLFGTSDELQHIKQYAREYETRYGEREIPVLELLDPEIGLGPPPTYNNPPPTRAWHVGPDSTYDISAVKIRNNALLAELIAQAHHQRVLEVELKPEDVASLDLDSEAGSSTTIPPCADVFFTLIKPNGPSERGQDYMAILSPMGFASQAGRAFGRFGHLEPKFSRMLREAAQVEQKSHPKIAYADLLFSDVVGRRNNITTHPKLYDHQICIGVTPSVSAKYHIPLNDLYVGLSGESFYLWSRTLNKQVLVRTSHLFDRKLAPNVVRFLQEVSMTGIPNIPTWQWGPFVDFPFLPRVRYGRVILSPARWRVPKEIRGAKTSNSLWKEAFQSWRSEWQVPRYVRIRDSDNWLVTDLDSEIGRELFQKQRPNIVEECLDLEGLWVKDGHGQKYCSECVVSVTFSQSKATLIGPKTQVEVNASTVSRRKFPGEEIIYLKLYGPRALQNDLLFRLQHEISGLTKGSDVSWFFVRYSDPFDHLRIRIMDTSSQWASLLEALLSRLRAQANKGLIHRVVLETYEPEIERYGGVHGLRICEKVFCVDSQAVLSLLQLNLKPEIMDMAAISVDAFLEGLQLGPHARLRIYRALHDKYRRLHTAQQMSDSKYTRMLYRDFRSRRESMLNLMAVCKPRNGNHSFPEDWHHRLADWTVDLRNLVTAMGAQLCELTTKQKHSSVFDEIYGSLVHMHANRLGLSLVQEHKVIFSLMKAYEGFRKYIPDTIDPSKVAQST